MKTLEACSYLQDHKDEYLVAKDNENFELHYDGKQFETKYFIEDSADILRNKLTLDFSTLNTEWVKIEKLYTYVFLGFIDNKLIEIYQEELRSDEEAKQLADKIQYELYTQLMAKSIMPHRTKCDSNVKMKYFLLHGVDLNPITKI
jgi:hypothetical protein